MCYCNPSRRTPHKCKPQDAPDLELEYLRYFRSHADFGPADSDVKRMIDDGFKRDTGKPLPRGYESEE
jgi:hypothetical protein